MLNKKMKLFSIISIPVYLHITTLILLGLILIFNGFYNLYLSILVFISVIFHEFGHCLAAKKYGINTESICIYPIGGIAFLNSEGNTPIQSLIIAIFGPLFSFLLFCIFAIIYSFFEIEIFIKLSLMNFIIFLFNLLPAYPLDGGRILKSILLSFFSSGLTKIIVYNVSCIIAAILLLIGIYGLYVPFILISIFILLTNKE